MSEEPADGAGAESATESPGGEETTVPRFSDDGIMLLFSGAACLLATLTATTTGQPAAVWALAAASAVVAVGAVGVDVAADYVPRLRVHLFVGVTAGGAAALSVPGEYWINAATLGAAAALVLWRVVDVRFRDAEQRRA